MRYFPLSKKEKQEMMEIIGVKNVDDLYQDVPSKDFGSDKINMPLNMSESEISKYFAKLSAKNKTALDTHFFLGAGCYNHYIPSVVDAVVSRSEFLTSYTPYQPEISQGTLTMIFEFQSMVCEVTGMEVSNASMYDGATATAEAILMAKRISKKDDIIVVGKLHPDYREVIDGYIPHNVGEIVELGIDINDINKAKVKDFSVLDEVASKNNVAAILVQNPDFYGNVFDIELLRKKCDEMGALLIVAITEIVSLGLIPAPRSADIVVGEAASIGVKMSFGGPHLGFFACKKQHIRQMPGRICGETVDADGKKAFVLTLCAREQHIRREKATSNICSNQGVCALAFTVHMSLLGKNGLKKLALINHKKACDLADDLAKNKNIKIVNQNFFNEFVIEINSNLTAYELNKKLLDKNIIFGLPLSDKHLLVATTEANSKEDIEIVRNALNEIL